MKYLLDGEQSKRLAFRKIEMDDFSTWLEFHKDPNSRKHWVADFKNPEIECENWYKFQFYRYENKLGGLNALIEKKSGSLIGHCGLLVQTVDEKQELEIGYSLLTQFWNQGFATEAARYCRDYAFQNELTDRLISIISKTNLSSQKVALKNGMRISKSTVYRDNEVDIFQLIKSEWKALK